MPGGALTVPLVLAQSSAPAGPDDFIQGDLSSQAHIFLAVATFGAMAFILVLVRRGKLSGKYALLWTVVAAVLGVLAIWPGLLTWVSEKVGIHYPPALFLLVTTGFLFVVVIHFSYELTKLEERTRTLAEEIALMRADRAGAGAGDGPRGSGGGTRGAEGDDQPVRGVPATDARE